MRMFTKDPQVIHAAQTLLWIAVALETGRVFNLIVIGALRATGDAIYPVVASLARFAALCFVVPPAGWTLSHVTEIWWKCAAGSPSTRHAAICN